MQEMKFQDAYNVKQIESLTHKLDKKKHKITKLLEDQNKQQLDFKKLKEEFSEKDIRLKMLQDKLSKYEEMTANALKMNNLNSLYKSSNDLTSTLIEFKQYVKRAENSIVRMSTDRVSLTSSVTPLTLSSTLIQYIDNSSTLTWRKRGRKTKR